MAPRKDGEETRARIIESACEVFAEKGYQSATVADICRRANANVAAVNYHFGGKAALYVAAWQHSYLHTVSDPDLDLSGTCVHDPEDLLCAYIMRIIHSHATKGAEAQFTRLYLMEKANPTGLIQESWRDIVNPKHQRLKTLVKNVAGQRVPEEVLLFCELSIISQCHSLLTLHKNDFEFLLQQPYSEALLKRWAKHITRFSLAGIKAATKPSGIPPG